MKKLYIAVFRLLKKLAWLLISPIVVAMALIYFRKVKGVPGLLTPFGLVLFLIFITAKTEDDEGPF